MSFANCRSALEAAGSPGLAAYSTCVRGVIRESLQPFGEAVNVVDARRAATAELVRSATDYYTVVAADCAQERTIRAQLEEHSVAVSEAIAAIAAARERIAGLEAEATALLATSVIGGFVSKAANHVQYLLQQTDVAVARIDDQLASARELLSDLQQTTVENRCGSAEALPDSIPAPTPPTADPSGRTDLPDGSARFDSPTVGGVALSPCRYRAHCDGRDGVNAFCHAHGFQRSGDWSMSSHGDVPTRTVDTGNDFPAGSSVVRYVICHP